VYDDLNVILQLYNTKATCEEMLNTSRGCRGVAVVERLVRQRTSESVGDLISFLYIIT